MPEIRARSLPAEGPAAVFDPSDPARFIALAGAQLIGVRGNTAEVRTEGGDPVTVFPGWVVIVPEGGAPVFTTPERAEILPQQEGAPAAVSVAVAVEDKARYDEASPARALAVAGDRADIYGGGLRVQAANETWITVLHGQWVLRYGPGDVGVMDEGEHRRFFGEPGRAA
jgi:hypothetical protein